VEWIDGGELGYIGSEENIASCKDQFGNCLLQIQCQHLLYKVYKKDDTKIIS
jgi:hypothetical protein